MEALNAARSVTIHVARALEQLNIGYFLAGSFASGVHGVFRASADTDLVANLPMHRVEQLAEMLSADFDADVEMMREAVRLRRSFNVVHFASLWKVDVFVMRERPYDAEALLRAEELQLDPTDPRSGVKVATPEDTVLAKLEWYRKGNEVSDRQWADVNGIIRLRRGRLDEAYLRRWAKELNVAELLERALAIS